VPFGNENIVREDDVRELSTWSGSFFCWIRGNGTVGCNSPPQAIQFWSNANVTSMWVEATLQSALLSNGTVVVVYQEMVYQWDGPFHQLAYPYVLDHDGTIFELPWPLTAPLKRLPVASSFASIVPAGRSSICGLLLNGTLRCYKAGQSDQYEQWMNQAGPFIALDVSDSDICVIRHGSNTAQCFRRPSPLVPPDSPTPLAISDLVHRGGWAGRGWCGFGVEDARVLCWPPRNFPKNKPLMSRIVATNSFFCGLLLVDSSMVCWGLGDEQYTIPFDAHTTSFIDIVSGPNQVCAIRKHTLTLACINNRVGPPSASVGEGYQQIAICAPDRMCVIQAEGLLTCSGNIEWKYPPWLQYQYVACTFDGSSSRVCAILVNGTVLCNSHVASLPLPPGIRLHQIAFATSYGMCGILATDDYLNNTIKCWGTYVTEDYWIKLQTNLTFASLPSSHTTWICGLLKNTSISCWGLYSPENMHGPFVEVSSGGDYVCARNAQGAVTCRSRSAYTGSDYTAPPLWVARPAHRGQYNQGTRLFNCPLGTYATYPASTRMCSGPCSAGYYGTGVHETCSGICQPGFTCPLGAAYPSPCPNGTFGSYEGLFQPRCQADCPPGFYCPSQSESPIPCPAGRYGNARSLATDSCSGPCERGWFCPAASQTSRGFECGGANLYCPSGVNQPQQVPTGHYSVGGNVSVDDQSDPLTRYDYRPCLPGQYCQNGGRRNCEPGTFSDRSLASTCTSCNAGESYAKLSESERRSYIHHLLVVCIGTYQPQNRSINCEVCPGGYYCLAGTSNPPACGSVALYCEAGSKFPQVVDPGYYSIDEKGQDSNLTEYRVGQKLCEAGYYCQRGIRLPCASGASTNGSVSCGNCPPATEGIQGKCSSCTVGKVSPSGAPCELCAKGRYALDKIICDLCGPGRFSELAGQTTCRNCTAGNYYFSCFLLFNG
jgi:hypothetical protein